MKTSAKRYKDVDWELLYKQLYVHARKLMSSATSGIDSDISAGDLVGETLDEFIGSLDGLGWTPQGSAKLVTFLCAVMGHKFIDHLRRQQFVKGSLDDEEFRQTIPDQDDNYKKVQSDIEFQDLKDKVLATIKGDNELEDYVAACDLIDGGHNINQELASVLDVSVQEVINRKKRLLRNEELKALYGRG